MNFECINAEIAANRLELNVEKAEKTIQQALKVTQLSAKDLEYQQIENVIVRWREVVLITVSHHWIVISGGMDSEHDDQLEYPFIDTKTALEEGLIPKCLVENLEKAQRELSDANSVPEGQKHVNDAIRTMGIDNVRRYINER